MYKISKFIACNINFSILRREISYNFGKAKSVSEQRNLLRGNKRDTIFIISRGATLNHEKKP